MYKSTVKSCGCTQCKFAKGSNNGNHQMKSEERSARRATKRALKINPEEAVISPAHRGNRVG